MPDTFKPTLRQRLRLLVTGHPVHALSAAVPMLSFYGGATVTRAHDATGALFTVCCAKNLALNAFGLYSLKDGVAQQIAPLVSGRGSIWISLFDGTASWVGFDGNVPPSGGPIPDFVPFPSLLALQSQLTALSSLIAALPPTTTGPIVTIPARDAGHGAMLYLSAVEGFPWLLDVTGDGVLRISRGTTVYERWPK